MSNKQCIRCSKKDKRIAAQFVKDMHTYNHRQLVEMWEAGAADRLAEKLLAEIVIEEA